jgi:hypothetical protein
MTPWFTADDLCPILAVLKLDSELAHNSSWQSYSAQREHVGSWTSDIMNKLDLYLYR